MQRSPLPILALPRYAKCITVLAVDISLCVLTIWLAFYLRLGTLSPLTGKPLWAAGIAVTLMLLIFVVSGLYRAIFRYSGWLAILSVARATAVYFLLYASIITAIGIDGIPRTIGLIQPLLLLFAIGSSRALAHYWLGGMYRSQLQIASLPKTLIYGAGNAGRQLAAALSNGYEMRVMGFLDDDDRLHGHTLNSQPIFSPGDLPDLIKSKEITHVLLAIPSASRRRRNEILKHIGQQHVAVRTLPSLSDLAEGRVTTSDLRELDIDDLLGREPVTPKHILLTKKIAGKVVLVTGAGGSIGSELCRQVLKFNPERLLLVELSECALYTIHAELEGIQSVIGDQHPQIIPLLASVQDQQRLREIIDTWRPDTIYHAAAYKHVPLVEHNLAEGVKNNVLGTWATVTIAIEKNVSDFVLISTDKAVRPTNVMGASKRLAEMILQAQDAKYKRQGKTRLSIVRFGNVLGSSGSVIPKFRKQIRDGGPITLTHPDINRFFMTIPEATQLVIQAASMANGGDVFVLDMGKPVRVQDLARRMIKLSGLTVQDGDNLEGDIEITVIGLRPGEKLYEEPLIGDDPQPTSHPRIMRAQDLFVPWDQLETDLAALRETLGRNDIDAILAILSKLVSGYQPGEKIVDWVYSEQTQAKANGTYEDGA